MKKRLVLSLVAAATAFGATVFAGEEKDGAKPQMFMIYKDVVMPSKTAEYEAAIKYLVSEFTAYDIDAAHVNWTTVYGPELGYAFVMPIDDFAAVDSMFKAWELAMEKIGPEKAAEIMGGASEAMDHLEAFHVMHRADLSYSPKEPAVKPDEVNFIHYSFYYIMPGKKDVIEEVAKSFATLYEAKGAKYGWSIYESVTGADMPLFVVAHPAKSQEDFYKHRAELKTLIGDEAQPLREKVMTATRRVEEKDGWLRPDLSYPAPEQAAKGDTAR